MNLSEITKKVKSLETRQTQDFQKIIAMSTQISEIANNLQIVLFNILKDQTLLNKSIPELLEISKIFNEKIIVFKSNAFLFTDAILTDDIFTELSKPANELIFLVAKLLVIENKELKISDKQYELASIILSLTLNLFYAIAKKLSSIEGIFEDIAQNLNELSIKVLSRELGDLAKAGNIASIIQAYINGKRRDYRDKYFSKLNFINMGILDKMYFLSTPLPTNANTKLLPNSYGGYYLHKYLKYKKKYLEFKSF